MSEDVLDKLQTRLYGLVMGAKTHQWRKAYQKHVGSVTRLGRGLFSVKSANNNGACVIDLLAGSGSCMTWQCYQDKPCWHLLAVMYWLRNQR